MTPMKEFLPYQGKIKAIKYKHGETVLAGLISCHGTHAHFMENSLNLILNNGDFLIKWADSYSVMTPEEFHKNFICLMGGDDGWEKEVYRE